MVGIESYSKDTANKKVIIFVTVFLILNILHKSVIHRHHCSNSDLWVLTVILGSEIWTVSQVWYSAGLKNLVINSRLILGFVSKEKNLVMVFYDSKSILVLVTNTYQYHSII